MTSDSELCRFPNQMYAHALNLKPVVKGGDVHLSGRERFRSAGSSDTEGGRAASASTVRPLIAATDAPSAAESSVAAGDSSCRSLHTCAAALQEGPATEANRCGPSQGLTPNRGAFEVYMNLERSKVSEMHLVVSVEDGHLLEVLCKGILQSVQRSAVAFGSSLQKALRKASHRVKTIVRAVGV